MGIFPFLVVVWIVVVGLYGIVTSRDLIHQIVCLIVVQSSTYVLLLGVGYVTGGAAPYFFDIPQRTKAVDPIVQALALTDVVVEAAVTALLLSFAVQAYKRSRSPSLHRSRSCSFSLSSERTVLTPHTGSPVSGPFAGWPSGLTSRRDR